MLPAICIDTESFYSADFSVKTLGYDRYCRDPRFDCYLVSVCDGSETWAGHPRDFNFDSLNGRVLLSHNRAFDEEVALAEAEAGRWPKIKHAGWHCTANMAAYLWNVRSLKDAMFAGFGESVDKGVRDRAKGKTEADMRAEGWWDEMIRYAGSDAFGPWRLWQKYGHLWPEHERRLSHLTIKSGRYGIAIDAEALQQGIVLMGRVIQTANDNLPWIARGRAPASPIGIAEECRMAGIPPPPVKAHDPEAAAAWETEYAPRHGFVLALRNLRKAKKTLATLETIKLRLRPDGTVAISTKYFGAHTGRWAGDAGWNVQAQNREPLFVDANWSFVFDKAQIKDLVEAFDASAPLPAGISALDMRGLIVARPGKKLVPVDLANIEPRTLNWLAGDFAFLDLIAKGYSPYEAHGRTAPHVKWQGGDMKKENKPLYQMMKVEVLMFGYRAGWKKAIVFAESQGVNLTEKDEEYALKAAVDGQVHRRMRVGDDWVYESAPEGCQVPRFEPGPVTGTFERCVFVRALRKGVEYLRPLSVYGMQARTVVANFRASKTKIVALWEALDGALEQAVGQDLILELPSGRCLTYHNVRREARVAKDEETGKEVKRLVFTAEISGRRSVFHGGLLAENISQAVARDVFAEGYLRLEDAIPGCVRFTVHDEAVPEVDLSVSKAAVEACFAVTPSWLPGCPIGAEAIETQKYRK